MLAAATPAGAGIGDLLVAPTRIVLDGRKGAEIILNNIGDDPATYRISVEFRRMTPDGGLVDVAEPNAEDKLAAGDDRLCAAPGDPGAAPAAVDPHRRPGRRKGLPDGEYRVHLLFRAIPPPRPVSRRRQRGPKGISFALIPVYGVTIPVIVRLGNLQAKAGIANVHLDNQGRQAGGRARPQPLGRPLDLRRSPRVQGRRQGPDRHPAGRRGLHGSRRAGR